MAERVYVGVDGLRDLQKLLKLDSILGDEWKRAMEEARDYSVGVFRNAIPVAAQRRAKKRPGDKRPAQETIRGQIQARPVPTWARVKFDAKVIDGFRVMGALEGGSRYHRSRGGAPTNGWWSGAIKAGHAKAQQILGTATKAIEQRWSTWKGVIWLSQQR